MGDGGTGKTATTIQFVANHFVEMYDPTIEDSYKRQILVDDHSFSVDILDTAGQDDFSPLRDSWIRDSEAFLLIYSVTDARSLDYLDEILRLIRRAKEGVATVPIVLAGNKCDLVDRRQVSAAQAAAWAAERGVTMTMEMSAKTRVNVEESFHRLVRAVAQRELDAEKAGKRRKRHNAEACAIL